MEVEAGLLSTEKAIVELNPEISEEELAIELALIRESRSSVVEVNENEGDE